MVGARYILATNSARNVWSSEAPAMKGWCNRSLAVERLATDLDRQHRRKSWKSAVHLEGSFSVGGACVAMTNRAWEDGR